MSNFFEETRCLMPAGAFLDTCHSFELDTYYSTDERVPTLCKLEAICTDDNGYEIENVIYLPVDVNIQEVANVNGYLAYGEKPLSRAAEIEAPGTFSRITDYSRSRASESINSFVASSDTPIIAPVEVKSMSYEVKLDPYNCIPLSGSYALTCKTETLLYKSTDPNLHNTELCEAKLDCLSLERNEISSMVYFNIANKELLLVSSLQKLENCDARLVLGVDNRCNGKKNVEIKTIAEAEGKNGIFRF